MEYATCMLPNAKSTIMLNTKPYKSFMQQK